MSDGVHHPPARGSMQTFPGSGSLLSLRAVKTAQVQANPKRQRGQDEALAAKEELRRQRNRVHQARHKKKQRQRVIGLELSIHMLREEIQQLQVQRHTISHAVPTTKSVWGVAAEYFRLFRNGRQAPLMAVGAIRRVDPHVQNNFLRVAMAPDVVGETGSGVERLLKDWEMITRIHEDFDVQLERLEYGSEDSLVAITKVRCSVSENTIRYAFPNLMSETGELSLLAYKLLGQHFVIRGAVRFEWDDDSNRVASVQNEADMLTPMLQLLGSLEDVSRVFERSCLSPACKFVY